eukprot:TRINITY_DN1869_c0_g1_i11.p1 TRINITY_DN1869_c0_g1~~TRINITY_DN1869_c0_g1_i11.p1  ORF type:complete len:272 (-),score=38.41 TRINITY_DN1869_c0_g1_i11:1259-2074(-)
MGIYTYIIDGLDKFIGLKTIDSYSIFTQIMTKLRKRLINYNGQYINTYEVNTAMSTDTAKVAALDLPDPEKITLFWENLTFRIPAADPRDLEEGQGTYLNVNMENGRPMRTIVENLTGIARPGEIIGLLGPSGSGKTVLLNIFSDRLHPPKGSQYARDVYVNNRVPLSCSLFGRVAAYVMQDDVLLETLTPYECLKFSANLRLPYGPEEKERAVLKVIANLRLQNCRDTLVKGGVSVGGKCAEERNIGRRKEKNINRSRNRHRTLSHRPCW